MKANEEKLEKKKETNQDEPLYTLYELARYGEDLIGYTQECIEASLKDNGKDYYTISEAKEIVKRFMNKEVK